MEKELFPNGINASTGEYLIHDIRLDEIIRLACREAWDPAHLAELKEKRDHLNKDHMDVVHGVDVRNIAEAGWGAIFPHGYSEEIREALDPLLTHRRNQANMGNKDLYHEIIYRAGESKPAFIARHGVGPGPVNPAELPYYLLIVGSPEEIPYQLQYQLDIQYAVGRISFDTPAEYAQYAENVVAAEMKPAQREHRMVLFGVANQDDSATQRSMQDLMIPLAKILEKKGAKGSNCSPDNKPWEIKSVFGEAATKARLARLLDGSDTPSILFTASHGVGFEPDDPRRIQHQGAILCQDWPGPRQWRKPIPIDHYFSCDDASPKSDISGLIVFHFACYSAGTPPYDEYAHRETSCRRLPSRSFVARLPQRLLAHPGGGALAVVAHVDRTWSYSFRWPQVGRQLEVFTSTFGRLFDHYPIGAAMEYFNQRYAELAADLSAEIEHLKHGDAVDHLSLSGMWTAHNDARSYIVLGDPFVHINLA